jgi:2-hydroxychromene-2-carboxylate isomerase
MEEEFPPAIRLPGQAEPPREWPQPEYHEPPVVVDELVDSFGAEAAATRLARRLEQVRPPAPGSPGDGPGISPPISRATDRIDGSPSARSTLLVFGAHGTPASQALGRVLAHVREGHFESVRIVWRHYPHPRAHPRAGILALAAEAAAGRDRFWALTRELLALRHHEPADLDRAMRRASLDPERTTETMRTGFGSDRIVAETASALASGVMWTPTLFIDGERYRGELHPGAVAAALNAAR